MLVIIDPSVEDPQRLAAGVQPGAEVLLLDPRRDGVEQIAQALKESTNPTSLHLIAHGFPGGMKLGATRLSLNNLDRYARVLQTWSKSLTGASLLLYGCQVALGEVGRRFLSQLHQLTGANLAASTEKVGSVKQGGNWTLDYQIGQVIEKLAFLPHVREAYPGVFANYDEATDGDISGDRLVPDALMLEEGVNSLTATSAAGDREYITVTVPEGFQLDSLNLVSYASSDDIAFAGVQSGTTFTEPPEGTNVANLLGWTHMSATQEGTDILDNIGSGQGAIGFTAPLPSGDYTFWLGQTGASSTYTLEFNVSEVDGGGGGGGTEPTVSLQTIAGAFDSADNLLAPALVQSLEEGASLLTFVLSVEGEIPEGGLEVTVNSDIVLTDYFLNLGYKPFSPGGEVLEAVYDQDGKATGFKFRIDEANAIINLAVKDDGETNEPTPATFTLEAAEGYTVSPESGASTVTFYDTLEQVPDPTITPQISLSISESALDESTGNTATLTFTLSEPPSAEGVIVYVRGAGQTGGEGNPTGRDLADFDIYNAEITGGVFPAPNFAANGFYFKITEPTATITLPAFVDEEVEGIEEFTFSLQETPGYTIDPPSGSVTLTVVDNPDSQIQVSLSAEPNALIESEGTVSIHKFSLSATPPEAGVTVSVSAPNLSEFNLDAIEVVGGEIVAVRDDGFDFKITAKEASIELPVASDGVDEGLEEATFTLEPGEGYQINADASSGSFQLVDIPEQAPADTVVSEPNDTIPLAIDTRLSSFNPTVTFNSSIDFEFDNSYANEDGSVTYVDASEDVDFYKVDLKAGDTIKIDTDSNQFEEGRKVDTRLRVFDSTGAELASNDDGAAPDEVFDAGFQSYIEFAAPEDGAYYVGVSLYNNGEYDPLTPGSGTGNSDPDPNEYGTGEYALNISLNNPDGFIAEPTEIPAGTGEGPAISLFTVAGTYGDDFDTLGFNILAPGIAETVSEGGGSALNLVLVANGEIPEGGIEVYIDSDIAFPDYFGGVGEEDYTVAYGGNLNGKPFSRGGEFLNAVYDEDGNAVGFKFLLEEPFATITLNHTNREEAETDGPETATFSIVESAGYTISPQSSSTVTFYDTLEQVPAPTTTPEVSLELSTTELIESEETELVLTLSLSEPPPPEGVQVYVSGNAQDFLNEFAIFEAEFTGGVPIADGAVSGFYFKMLEQTATITLPVFNSVDVTEGIEQFDVSLRPGAGYTVNPDQAEAVITIKDTPDAQVQVSLGTEPEVLIESEATVSVHTFSLSAAPPEGGVTVTVSAEGFSEFDAAAIETTGIDGEIEILESEPPQLRFTITAQTATIKLPVAADGESEGLEEATFTLEAGEGYQVSPDANTGTFTIADTPELAPTSTEESNDTIATAIATGLTVDNSSVSFEGEINQYFAEDDEGNELTVDATEDVDLYKVDLLAGQTLAIDVDAAQFGSPFQYSQLRVFDAQGTELAKTNFDDYGVAPDEVFESIADPYLEFTPETDGTYYVGVSQIGNETYDPMTLGSGSGWIFPDFGIESGEYTLNLNLETDGGSSGPTVSLTATPDLVTEEGGTPVTFNFNVTGPFPEEGLIVATTSFFISQFDFNNFDETDPEQFSGIEFFDFVELPTGEFVELLKLTEPNAFIKLVAFDDTIAEEDEVYTLSLLPSEDYELENYAINPNAASASVTISDGVPNLDEPVIGFSVEPTSLEEGDSLTVTLNVVDGVLPADGLEINLASETFASLGEFAIFDEEGNFLPVYEGFAAQPEPNGEANGFIATMTENTATITLDVFDDGANEGVEKLTFSLLDGESYGVAPDASEVTLTIDDGDEGRFFGGTQEDQFDAGVSPEGFNGSNDLVFAGAGDDLIDTSAGNGNSRLYGQAGNDIFYLGSNDRAFGGAGDDLFFALGGNNVLTGGADADQFWIAAGELPESPNTVTDFNLAEDVLGIGGLGLSFEDLSLTQQEGNTLIAAGEQELALLLGTNATTLSANNFAFG
jgi:Ca2+-binding RTX toxin-like protein